MYEQLYHKEDLGGYSFLVTGGAGFIGSHIVEYLLKFNAGKVRVLDNFSTGSRLNIRPFQSNPAFELIEGDIRSQETCSNAMKGIDFVTHQAALGSVSRSIKDPVTTNEVNINGFLNILVAARDMGIRKLVYAASSSTYGDHPGLPKTERLIGNPLSPYAVTKYVNELYAAVFSSLYGLHAIGLRYFNVFGPRQDPKGQYAAVIPLFINAALKQEAPFINGDGETSRDFTFVENAVQANIKAMMAVDTDHHEVVNIAFGERTTLNQLWESISRIAGFDAMPLYREERAGDIRHSLADISKARQLIGYAPYFSVQQGLQIAYDWYKNNIAITV